MMRIVNTLLLSFLVLLATGVYLLKTDSKLLNRKIQKLKTEIETSQSNSDVLRAEIAHLENPERLFRLSKEYLHLEPYDGSRSLDSETLKFIFDHKKIQENEL